MSTNIPAREVPFPTSFALAEAPVSKADREPEEPQLEVDQVQGNILAGFNKDNQILVFMQIKDTRAFKVWLRAIIPFVATTDEVLHFNRLFKMIRSRRGGCRGTPWEKTGA